MVTQIKTIVKNKKEATVKSKKIEKGTVVKKESEAIVKKKDETAVKKEKKTTVKAKKETKPNEKITESKMPVVKQPLIARVGSIVISTQGRDIGRAYMIYNFIDSSYVNLVDGKIRKIESPKKKKLKHVKLFGEELVVIAKKINTEKIVHDAEIASSIRKIIDKDK
jgi:ribosomal protein L14E/L6E/L27E